MAGIGFRLQQLLAADALSAQLKAYAYAALIATGPMLVTMLALGLVQTYAASRLPLGDALLFRGLVVYAYTFSLVGVGPWLYVITRYLGDKHYLQQYELFSATYCFCLALLLPLQALIGWSYGAALGLPADTLLRVLLLFLALTGTWIAMPFLSAARHVQWIVGSYAAGGLGSVLGIWALWQRTAAPTLDQALTVYATGALLTWLICTVRIVREFGTPTTWAHEVLGALREHPALCCVGICYHLGLWGDRWVFWLAPDAEIIRPGLRLMSLYDTPMFLAQLTILPAMSYLLIQIETTFARRFHAYFAAIAARATRAQILAAKDAMTAAITRGFQRFVLLQGFCSGILIVFIVPLTERLGLNAAQLGIFRIGILGAFLFMGFVITLTLLFYFDWQWEAAFVTALFAVANILLTLASRWYGLPAYGFGFALASFLAFATAVILLQRKLLQLEYWVFMRQPLPVPRFTLEAERNSALSSLR